MGERKGQNHYYPPDFDPVKHGNLNRYHGVHALRERANKIHLGILIIRFEMPFNVWCHGCENHVAMGVRYNAEKKKVGEYYTTPIYEFKMRCHRCENYFIIRTDPANFDYECVEGLQRKEQRWDAEEYGDAVHDRTEALKLASDPMYKLEHVEVDKKKKDDDEPRVEQIEDIQDRMNDDFAANQALRSKFRTKKKELAKVHASDQALLAKSSLPSDLKLVPEDEQDRRLASLMAQYRTVASSDEQQVTRRRAITSQSIFKPSTSSGVDSSKISSPTKTPFSSLKLSVSPSSGRKSIDSTTGSRKRPNALLTGGLVVKKKKSSATEIRNAPEVDGKLVPEVDCSNGIDSELTSTSQLKSLPNSSNKETSSSKTTECQRSSSTSCSSSSTGFNISINADEKPDVSTKKSIKSPKAEETIKEEPDSPTSRKLKPLTMAVEVKNETDVDVKKEDPDLDTGANMWSTSPSKPSSGPSALGLLGNEYASDDSEASWNDNNDSDGS